jgi:tyrosyl-tRNA synthetase
MAQFGWTQINVRDEGVEKYLKVYTEFDQPRIEQIIKDHDQKPGARLAQTELAKAATTLVHGEEATKIAEMVTAILTGKTKLSEVNDPRLIDDLRRELPSIKAENNTEVAQILVDSGLSSSKTEARKLISSNSIYINGEKVSKENLEPGDFSRGRLIIRRGKAFKDSALVEIG